MILHGKQYRCDLGPAVEGGDDVGGLSVDGVRSRAARIAKMARRGPAHDLAAVATSTTIETQMRIDAEKPKKSWTWEHAKGVLSRRAPDPSVGHTSRRSGQTPTGRARPLRGAAGSRYHSTRWRGTSPPSMNAAAG